ncbi:MAG: LysM peptidoglycan-binding domain-containing protein [Cytophagaceae bacterium]|jgi:membrane-bound lytic murein transglycosylase D|nr:LysM peptidoglycan-binding domain-containing protein [Cytophagaceae bacterium]
MIKNKYITKRSLIFTCAIFLGGVLFSNAQTDSSTVHESADSTIVQAEVLDSIPAVAAPKPTAASTEELTEQEKIIAARLKVLQNEVKLTYNKKIKGFIDYFLVRNQRYTVMVERRRAVYFPLFDEILQQQKMPQEIKYLAIVESGLNPKAVSPVGAAGLWQFMTFTGKQFGLYQDEYIDERLDPRKSTVAACKYLRELYNTFHDWELALASYNCGPGNVRRAIRKSGYKDSFWEIYNFLPQETRSYVPQFVALTYVMNHLKDHNIMVDSLEYAVATDTVTVHQYLDLTSLSESLNLCSEDLRKLNPSIKKGVLSGTYPYQIKLPIQKMAEFYLNKTYLLDACAKPIQRDETRVNTPPPIRTTPSSSGTSTTTTKIYYTVKSGDALGTIAARYGVTVTDIKRWNSLSSSTIRIGQRLVIYKKGIASGTTTGTVSRTTTTTSPTYYTVKSGDSLWTISQKTGVSVEKLKKLNGLTSGSIRPGQKLKLK